MTANFDNPRYYKPALTVRNRRTVEKTEYEEFKQFSSLLKDFGDFADGCPISGFGVIYRDKMLAELLKVNVTILTLLSKLVYKGDGQPK